MFGCSMIEDIRKVGSHWPCLGIWHFETNTPQRGMKVIMGRDFRRVLNASCDYEFREMERLL
jgi:hypothetical protein